jgi:hypothetical protein
MVIYIPYVRLLSSQQSREDSMKNQMWRILSVALLAALVISVSSCLENPLMPDNPPAADAAFSETWQGYDADKTTMVDEVAFDSQGTGILSNLVLSEQYDLEWSVTNIRPFTGDTGEFMLTEANDAVIGDLILVIYDDGGSKILDHSGPAIIFTEDYDGDGDTELILCMDPGFDHYYWIAEGTY